MNRTKVFEQCFNAAQHYRDTGKHKQVSFRYNPEERTQFEFSSWKHERDHHSVRKILVEDIKSSSDGNIYVVGVDNRYNLKQFANQHPQHVRSYRIDRIHVL